MTLRRLPAIAALCLLPAVLVGATRDTDVEVTADEDGLLLAWSDARFALRGRVKPVALRVGEPVRVSIRLGTSEGKALEGPATLTFRPADDADGARQTVEPKDGLWTADFVPRVASPHVLDIAFEGERPRVLHARLEVSESRLSRGVVWGAGGIIAALALIFGIRRLARGTTRSV